MGLINSHAHLLNFNFVPNSFFRTRAPFREWLYRRRGTRWAVWVVSRFTPGIRYKKLHELLALMDEDINVVAQALLTEMAAAQPEIAMATPLMMDLEAACEQKPEVPYRVQIAAISRLALESHGRLMPFIMVDPRRPDAARLTIDCLENRGFLGVKMYPPLGYHPDPKSIANPPEINKQLEEIFEYCSEKSVPITTHCSKTGAYANKLKKAREVCRECARPSSWAGVLRDYPGIRLNLAHFGGDLLENGDPYAWSTQIEALINDEQVTNLFTDLSYHDEALKPKQRDEYFSILNRLIDSNTLLSKRILFSTDWPMTRHSWTEAEYVAPFLTTCKDRRLNKIGFVNPLEFLFGGKGLPNRYKTFLENNGRQVSDLAPWLLEVTGQTQRTPVRS